MLLHLNTPYDLLVSTMGVPDAYDGCQSIQSDATAESSEDSRRSSFQTSSQASDCGAFAVDIATSDWEGLPAPLLQLIGAQLSVSDLAAGRHTCAAWRTGLSLGVESLAPLVHDGKSFLDPARWAVLEKVCGWAPIKHVSGHHRSIARARSTW